MENTSTGEMSQLVISASISGTPTKSSWKDCAFFKVPPEIRIQIWELCLTERECFSGYYTPKFIQAFLVKGNLEVYYEGLAIYWRVTTFVYRHGNYRNFRITQNIPQFRSIQNLTCIFDSNAKRQQGIYRGPINLFRASGVRHLVLRIEDPTDKFHNDHVAMLFNFLGACLYYFEQLELVKITFAQNSYAPDPRTELPTDKSLLARCMSNISMVKSAFCVYNESGRIGDTYQVTEWAWRAESGNKLELVDVVSKQLEECIIFRGVIGLAELVPPLDRPLFDPLDTDSVPFWSPNCR